VSSAGEVRDQVTMHFTTVNKHLPLVSLDCYRVYFRPRVKSQPLTLAMIEELMGQPGFFQSPRLSAKPSQTFEDLIPSFQESSRVKLLQPLKFAAVESGNGLSLSNPYFKEGKVYYLGQGLGPMLCSASYHPDAPFGPFEAELPAGKEYLLSGVAGLSKAYGDGEESQLFNFDFRPAFGNEVLIVQCRAESGYFESFREIERHLSGIFALEF